MMMGDAALSSSMERGEFVCLKISQKCACYFQLDKEEMNDGTKKVTDCLWLLKQCV
jgi:hypothetical protein